MKGVGLKFRGEAFQFPEDFPPRDGADHLERFADGFSDRHPFLKLPGHAQVRVRPRHAIVVALLLLVEGENALQGLVPHELLLVDHVAQAAPAPRPWPRVLGERRLVGMVVVVFLQPREHELGVNRGSRDPIRSPAVCPRPSYSR